MLVSATVSVAVALALAPVAGAHGRVSFERMKGYDAPRTPAKYDKVGVIKVGSPRARNVLVLNPGTSASASYFVPLAKDVVEERGAGRSGRSSAGRTCSRTTPTSTRPRPARPRPQQVFDYYLRLDHRLDDHQPRPADPRLRGRLRARVGHARGDRGPPPRRQGGEAARRQGRPRRPLARRLDHHRLRDLGLRRQAGRERPARAGVHRRRQRPDAGHRRAGERSRSTTSRARRRG